MNESEGQRYVVRLDGVPVEDRASHVDALGSARDLKRAVPEQLVTVWDTATNEAVIVEG